MVTPRVGDHLGTTSVVLNSSGGLVAESRHFPYGTERWTEGTLPTDYRFTAQREEESLGLYHMGARWIDPALGRWLSADTLVPDPSNPQSFNRYSWVLGNPLRYVDPTGFFTEEQLQEWFPDSWEFWQQNYPNFWEMLLGADFGDKILLTHFDEIAGTFVEGEDGNLYVEDDGEMFSLNSQGTPMWRGVPSQNHGYAYTLLYKGPKGELTTKGQFGLYSWRKVCTGRQCHWEEWSGAYYHNLGHLRDINRWKDASGLWPDVIATGVSGISLALQVFAPNLAQKAALPPVVSAAILVYEIAKITHDVTLDTRATHRRRPDWSSSPYQWR